MTTILLWAGGTGGLCVCVCVFGWVFGGVGSPCSIFMTFTWMLQSVMSKTWFHTPFSSSSSAMTNTSACTFLYRLLGRSDWLTCLRCMGNIGCVVVQSTRYKYTGLHFSTFCRAVRHALTSPGASGISRSHWLLLWTAVTFPGTQWQAVLPVLLPMGGYMQRSCDSTLPVVSDDSKWSWSTLACSFCR